MESIKLHYTAWQGKKQGWARHTLAESVSYYKDVCDTELEDFIKHKRKPTFQQLLFRYIDEKGADDSAIYKKPVLTGGIFPK